MRTLLLSAEFRASADQKFKRPLEMLSSATRTLAVELGPEAGKPLLNVLRNMGQLPFGWHAPNGYPDAAGAWANTNGLLGGWNLGLALGGNHLHDVQDRPRRARRRHPRLAAPDPRRARPIT